MLLCFLIIIPCESWAVFVLHWRLLQYTHKTCRISKNHRFFFSCICYNITSKIATIMGKGQIMSLPCCSRRFRNKGVHTCLTPVKVVNTPRRGVFLQPALDCCYYWITYCWNYPLHVYWRQTHVDWSYLTICHDQHYWCVTISAMIHHHWERTHPTNMHAGVGDGWRSDEQRRRNDDATTTQRRPNTHATIIPHDRPSASDEKTWNNP